VKENAKGRQKNLENNRKVRGAQKNKWLRKEIRHYDDEKFYLFAV
jgi:hypothetical protein